MVFPVPFAVRLLNVQKYSFENDVGHVPKRPFYALSLRISGDTDITISGKTCHLGNHSMALFPADTSYKRETKRDELLVIHFTADLPEPLPFTVFTGFYYERIHSLFSEAFAQYNPMKPSSNYTATALFYQILAEISRATEAEPPEQKSQIETYFREHCLSPDFSVTTAARDLFMCENSLRKACKKHFGQSPKGLCTAIRMDYAKWLLLSGYYSVAVIAGMSGFTDAKNFSTAYKKYFGVPPSKPQYLSQEP